MAGTPSTVPGILIMQLGRAMAPHSRRASAIVPWVSRASSGDTSIETKPSLPLDISKIGRNWSHAAWMSSIASDS